MDPRVHQFPAVSAWPLKQAGTFPAPWEPVFILRWASLMECFLLPIQLSSSPQTFHALPPNPSPPAWAHPACFPASVAFLAGTAWLSISQWDSLFSCISSPPEITSLSFPFAICKMLIYAELLGGWDPQSSGLGSQEALPSAWGPCHISAVSSSQPHSVNESVLVCCGCSWIVKQKWNPCTLSYLRLGRITLLLDLWVGREGEGQMFGWGWPGLMWVSLEEGRESRPLTAEQSRIPSLWAWGALKMSQSKCLISLSTAVSRIHCGREGPSSRSK